MKNTSLGYVHCFRGHMVSLIRMYCASIFVLIKKLHSDNLIWCKTLITLKKVLHIFTQINAESSDVCKNTVCMSALYGYRENLLYRFLTETKQLCPSVRPCLSVRLSHLFTMFPSTYHHKIFRNCYQCQRWCPCKRSRSEVKGPAHRGQNPI